jgi:hypothetical protein
VVSSGPETTPCGPRVPTSAQEQKCGPPGASAWSGALWLLVPQERVLPTDYAGDGRSHLCEKEGFIYCFTPGEIRG